MIKILFICHGNICRSPMAEFVMKDLVRKEKLEWKYEIASAATSSEELGNPVYPPARRKMAEHGISCAGKTARRLTPYDYDLTNRLIGYAQKADCPFAVDTFVRYSTDGAAAMKGGNDVKAAAFGMAVYGSHGVERTHVSGLEATVNLMLAYAMDI